MKPAADLPLISRLKYDLQQPHLSDRCACSRLVGDNLTGGAQIPSGSEPTHTRLSCLLITTLTLPKLHKSSARCSFDCALNSLERCQTPKKLSRTRCLDSGSGNRSSRAKQRSTSRAPLRRAFRDQVPRRRDRRVRTQSTKTGITFSPANPIPTRSSRNSPRLRKNTKCPEPGIVSRRVAEKRGASPNPFRFSAFCAPSRAEIHSTV
jgi:hypothetical protein